MKFGPVPVETAEGCVLAHAIKLAETRLSKGHILTQGDLAAIEAAGMGHVVVARLDPGDLLEDAAASRLAAVIRHDHVRSSEAATGRVNLYATSDGVFVADSAVVDRLNRIDPAITLACLADHVPVCAGDMVATIKIIPLAVAPAPVEEACALLQAAPAFAVKPFRALRVTLVATLLPSLKTSVMDKTRRILEERLRPSASTLLGEMRVEHTTEAIAAAIRQAAPTSELIIVFGASAVADQDDVLPAGLRAAGGVVDYLGMPVDPGNLIVIGHLGDIPVIGAPGCARSPKENGFDWVLNRILVGEQPSAQEISGMGVGGLLMEIPSRPLPRERTTMPEDYALIDIVVLAAGQASRMGLSGHHKLLAEFDGVPLVRKTVETAIAASGSKVVVVTGHRSQEIAGSLAGLDVRIVENPAYADGMASSLKTGLDALGDQTSGLLVMLADMPAIVPDDLRRMLAAFAQSKGEAVVRASHAGKRGNPVILPRATFAAIRSLEGDVGARQVVESCGLAIIDVELGPAAHLDLDTPDAVLAAGGILKG
ncbi:NTP transferase domain-containing protein [Pararhizobium antarcticum]|uniref:4-diphosphocytidyl-2C-methyl-D-erythritol kinase n=1 Tax=Pararhizobium antarcticum TaxID=1798805 RepID=A0A657LSY0_9HYPH|nr:molybdopterin-binding/glycosyltransferase family 2 protein [Pararhizobium antarcticum]OJF93355.1 4-diphosphocytidyl-2C-methyl-D-erythritol kinase [Pararhizobium antarcticum]OJF96009.1 4-diphosphocytidyl-2C-methyl-D-erythritol kinase [Rhizobium sp. 58]